MTFALLTEEEIKTHMPKVVRVDAQNKVVNISKQPLASFPPKADRENILP